jgi:ubiquinone/menaquinone biosynthesis C-methylase UbiE
MGLYNRWILPQVIELTMRQKNFVPFRERRAGAAHGRVVEIGIGSGLNLASYRREVQTVYGVDASAELLAKASQRVANLGFPVHLLEASSEKLPLEDQSFDTVVMTFTLCSIPDVGAALLEIRRVLKPEGELLFAEHGRAPDPDVMHWQDRLFGFARLRHKKTLVRTTRCLNTRLKTMMTTTATQSTRYAARAKWVLASVLDSALRIDPAAVCTELLPQPIERAI